MKKTCFIISLILASAALTLPARELRVVAPAKVGLSETNLMKVDQFMEQAVANQKIAGGIIIISREGKIGFFHTYGQRNIEAKQPMTGDTIFRIYSMSKAITTAAALTLYDDGKIKLEDPVSKYIPSFAHVEVATTNGLRAPSRLMTVKDLMTHTSGLTYGDGPQ